MRKNHKVLEDAVDVLVSALQVVRFTPHILRHLQKHDPRALKQIEGALEQAGAMEAPSAKSIDPGSVGRSSEKAMQFVQQRYPRAKRTRVLILDRYWEPTAPVPDSDELAAAGERCIMRFSREAEPEFFIAAKEMLYAGWVVGVPWKE